MAAAKTAIIEYLTETNGQSQADVIAANPGLSASSVSRAARQLLKEGRLNRVGRILYLGQSASEVKTRLTSKQNAIRDAVEACDRSFTTAEVYGILNGAVSKQTIISCLKNLADDGVIKIIGGGRAMEYVKC